MDEKWTLQSNEYGIPIIIGENELDALEAVGYANVQDRLIQMDYYRRFVTGRLSEIYGVSALANDCEMLKFEFDEIADKVVEALCDEDMKRLQSYCNGVNKFIRKGKLPIEYEVIKENVEEWTPKSCILVNIYTHYVLNYLGLKDEKMLTILKKHFPKEIRNFYTPDRDRYSDFKIFGDKGIREVNGFPQKELEAFYNEALKEKERICVKMTALMDKNCRIRLCFEGEKTYEAFRDCFIQKKLQVILESDSEDFQTEVYINLRGSDRFSKINENEETIHLEGVLPKFCKSVFAYNASFFEINVSMDINMKTFEGNAKMSVVKNKYFIYDRGYLPNGSNCMIIDGTRTESGKPVFANDPHLPFEFPNLFYLLTMRFADVFFQGFMVPGTPIMVSGNNQNICWGITSTASNFFDLVIIDSKEKSCCKCEKTIRIKVSKTEMREEKVHYYKSKFGPLLEEKLDGKDVAIRWNASDVSAYDYSFWKMVYASKTKEAVEIAQKAGCVPVNIIIGDYENNIAWTIAGRIPKRVGLEGDSAEYWKEGEVGWDGYIEPKEKPMIQNPKERFIVNANDRTYGNEYPYKIGHDFANGWRTHRISELLSNETVKFNKEHIWDVMTDVNCKPYDFYYQLIQLAVSSMSNKDKEELSGILKLLDDWNMQADKECRAMIVVNGFRDKLAQLTLLPLYFVAGKYQPFFDFQWFKFDEVLMSLWAEQAFYSDKVSEFYGYKTMVELFISKLYDVRNELQLLADFSKKDILDLKWGDVNRLHAGMRAIRFAGYEIFTQINKDKKLPIDPLSGSIMSVNACYCNVGPLFRFAVDMGDHKSMIVNHLGGNYGSMLSDSKYVQTSTAWANAEKIVISAK